MLRQAFHLLPALGVMAEGNTLPVPWEKAHMARQVMLVSIIDQASQPAIWRKA